MSTSELQQIGLLLATGELRLHNFQHVLPKLVRRRALIDFGGAVLITLFDTAIFSDISEFHEIFNELKLSQKIVHSISKQVTCIKKSWML